VERAKAGHRLEIDPTPPPSATAVETVLRAGYFDEQWRLPIVDADP
jgi:hypothetical protein